MTITSIRSYAEHSIDLNKELIPNPADSFFFQVETNAMIDAFIPPGSLLVVDKSLPAKNEDIVVVVLNGLHMVRRLVKNEHTCWLYPANKQHREQKITPEMNMTILGVVTRIILRTKAFMRD